MTINDIENFADEVKDVIRSWFKTDGFKDRKLTDTPTDDLQVVNKKYVDDNTPTLPWTLVASAKLPAASTTLIDATSISTNYDLFRIVVHAIAKATGTNVELKLRFNGDSGANYDSQFSKLTGAATNTLTTGASAINLIFGNIEAATTKTATSNIVIGKSSASNEAEVTGTTSYYDIDAASLVNTPFAGRWINTSSKITQITILTTTGQFDVDSSVVIEGYKG